MKPRKKHPLRQVRDVSYMKPARYKSYKTLSEVAARVYRDVRWIRRLDEQGRLPKPIRVKMGGLEVRLWSPSKVKRIEKIIADHKVGRPKRS